MKLTKSKLKEIIREEIQKLDEGNSKTIKYPTNKGTLHIEIEEDTAGIFVDVIFNKVDLTTTNIEFPAGDVSIRQKKKRVKVK
jgi:hypothetical protein